MQDISNVSHWGINPRPSLDTTFTVADDKTLSKPIDTTNNDTPEKRADNHTGLHMLRFLINEPGSKYQIIYNHIVRDLLNIASGGTMDNILDTRYWLARCRDNCKLEYFVIDLKKNGIDYYEWICSLEEDGIIDETKLDELLCINSYLNFMQNRTGPISDGYADITKCTRDDFVRFTKLTNTFDIEYNEKEAIESKERGTPDSTYGDMLPACGMLPTLQLPCLYGFPTSRNNKNTITKLDDNELTDESTSECKIVSDEDYSMDSSGEDNGDINPTTEDVKDSISAATDKVGISLLGSND